MTDNNQVYLDLITSEHAVRPNFVSYTKTFLDMLSPIIDGYNSYLTIFALSNAVGDQLDKLGSLIGLGRRLPIDDPDIPAVLDDETYRKVLTAKIYRDHWDGTTEGLDSIFRVFFPDVPYEIVDNQDMSYQVTIIDPNITPLDFSLISNGYIVPKPSGVKVNYTIQDSQIFGYDIDTQFVSGWDKGIWNSN